MKMTMGVGAVLAAAVVWIAAMAQPATPAAAEQDKKEPKYVGVEKCKNCHEAKAKGSQYTAWKGMKHSKAYEVLASDEAKKIAKEKGIDDPQKSEKCLKCHTTGFGLPPERIATNFKKELGVQCEACHGPGETHMKARMAAAGDEETDARVEVPDGEIIKKPTLKTCVGCHNEESPAFKPFCFKKRFAEIQHLDPRKKRTEEELKAMKCACGDPCKCKQGECGGFEEKK